MLAEWLYHYDYDPERSRTSVYLFQVPQLLHTKISGDFFALEPSNLGPWMFRVSIRTSGNAPSNVGQAYGLLSSAFARLLSRNLT